MKICLCVGARPNFMKAASVIRAFKKNRMNYRLIHTGQHYDKNMSQIFFDELEIPKPDINLGAWVEGDSPSQQIGRTMVVFARQMEINRPDLIIVFGDVNSTLACALVANKMGIKLAHIEAGERSFDRSMPEEANRILVDEISDLLFCASGESHNNLIDKAYLHEPEIDPYLVGDTMIDQLIYSMPEIDSFAVRNEQYAVLTIHRAGNVDNQERLEAIIEIAFKISDQIQIYFPCHPRVRKAMLNNDNFSTRYLNRAYQIEFVEPMSYLKFMTLVKNAKFVITDSGGLQVETSYLNIPCLTFRENTEHLDTIVRGSNVLVDIYKDDILKSVDKILSGEWKQSTFEKDPLHDGKAAERIVEILKKENKN